MHRFLVFLFQRRSVLSLVAIFVLVAAFAPASGSASARGGIQPLAKIRTTRIGTSSSPGPSDQYCRANIGVPCYSPQEMQNGYGVTSLLNSGFNGAGQTIVIFDSYGSPTAWSDLVTFDRGYNLPDPPSFVVLAPLGTVPWDPNNATMAGWAEETSLDVQWAHAMAPGANIVLMTSPVAESEGLAGMPEMYEIEQVALKGNYGNVWSQSWGATENGLMNPTGLELLNKFNYQYQQAGQQGISVFASAGDGGVANLENNQTTDFPFPTVIFPASSPWVTAVGGTSLYLSTVGAWLSETVWNNGAGGAGATGGGVSQIFAEPTYQVAHLPTATQTILNHKRGLPDISWNADPYTSIPVYLGFNSTSLLGAGYYLFGGTSEGAPQWAGVTADLNQAVGAPLGFINPRLYALGTAPGYNLAFHDQTTGNNSFSGITGYNATTGWDPTTGWGSPNLYVWQGLEASAKH